MRLLNAKTKKLCYFLENNAPPYAILSHTWGSEEVTYTDMQRIWPRYKRKKGWSKIKWCCRQALQDCIEYVWADTCCIDKSSSSELQEAINSMYRWYENALICYTYLVDVTSGKEPNAAGSDFRKSRWHTRGWTLQELLAPRRLIFYDASWKKMGTRCSLRRIISSITGINEAMFDDSVDGSRKSLGNTSIAQKMSWAAGRSTTRPEDMAYCLLGIFEINMPLLYGEGEKAFTRLQEEIMKNSDDQTILAWSLGKPINLSYRWSQALATSPDDFSECSDLVSLGVLEVGDSFSMTQRGLGLNLPIVDLYGDGKTLYCLLNCSLGSWRSGDCGSHILALPLLRTNSLYGEPASATQLSKISNIPKADVYTRLTQAIPVWIPAKYSHGRPRRMIYLPKPRVSMKRIYPVGMPRMVLTPNVELPADYFIAGVLPPALRHHEIMLSKSAASLVDGCVMIHIARPSQPGLIIVMRYLDDNVPMIAMMDEDENKSFLDYSLNSEIRRIRWINLDLIWSNSDRWRYSSDLIWGLHGGSLVALQVFVVFDGRYRLSIELSVRLTTLKPWRSVAFE